MDKDEEEGLRAFALDVGCHPGGSESGDPAWVNLGAKRIRVAEIESQWREEERRGFRVRLENGSWLLLYHVPGLHLWSGVAFAEDATAETLFRRK